MKRKILRVCFGWFEVALCAASCLGLLNYASPSSAQAAPAHFAIGKSQVVAAMQEGRLPVDGVQVQLAAPVTASVSAARIEVKAASPIGPHQVRLRLGCSGHGECLPFLATATYADGVDVRTLHLDRDASAKADRRPELGSSVATEDTRSVKTAAKKDSEVLRAGSTAMLEFEADRIHVRIEVLSLQSGLVGSRIRVSSIDHKQIYTAEVVTPTLLKGELAK